MKFQPHAQKRSQLHTHVILGHSERRHIFRETSEELHNKLKMALEEGLRPVFCVGELLEERESGAAFDVIRKQLLSGLKSMDGKDVAEKDNSRIRAGLGLAQAKPPTARMPEEVCIHQKTYR